ncbi:hypothetical protein [Brachybacterium sp. YJGR34]|uniref:hypothetical protein n=1 Tax=Brachybacterium sp. YJGR34 TaxID=2059911 RepID=UPI000E0B8AE5|nr:hypothetical protein [Brachybacterium sp. YJGR34]
MVDDHVRASPVSGDPADLARVIVKRPGMYMGGPVTFERAAAYTIGVEMALIATDRDPPLTEEDHRLLQERPRGRRSLEQELAHIRRLEPLLAKLFTALQEE